MLQHSNSKYCVYVATNNRGQLIQKVCNEIFRKSTLPGLVLERTGACVRVNEHSVVLTNGIPSCGIIHVKKGDKEKIFSDEKCMQPVNEPPQNETFVKFKSDRCKHDAFSNWNVKEGMV